MLNVSHKSANGNLVCNYRRNQSLPFLLFFRSIQFSCLLRKDRALLIEHSHDLLAGRRVMAGGISSTKTRTYNG